MHTFNEKQKGGILREIMEASSPRIVAAFHDSDLLLAARKYARLNDEFHVHLVEAAIYATLNERALLVGAFLEYFRALLVEVVCKDSIPRELPEHSGLSEFVMLGTIFSDLEGAMA